MNTPSRFARSSLFRVDGAVTTYRGTDTLAPGPTPVFIHEFRLANASDWKACELLARKVTVLQQAHHPGLPQILWASDLQADTFAYVERDQGATPLRTLLGDQPLDEAGVRNILTQTLEILHYLHTRVPPIIHRDVSPETLTYRPDGTLLLGGFDTLQVGYFGQDGGSTVVVQKGYSPLEQIIGQATPASDLYALGVTCVALLTGYDPRELPTRDGRIVFEHHVSHISSELVEVLAQLTDPHLDTRTATAQDALLSLGIGAEAAPSSRAAPSTPPLPDPHTLPPEVRVTPAQPRGFVFRAPLPTAVDFYAQGIGILPTLAWFGLIAGFASIAIQRLEARIDTPSHVSLIVAAISLVLGYALRLHKRRTFIPSSSQLFLIGTSGKFQTQRFRFRGGLVNQSIDFDLRDIRRLDVTPPRRFSLPPRAGKLNFYASDAHQPLFSWPIGRIRTPLEQLHAIRALCQQALDGAPTPSTPPTASTPPHRFYDLHRARARARSCRCAAFKPCPPRPLRPRSRARSRQPRHRFSGPRPSPSL